MEQFLINDLHRAFRLDALTTSHPITVDVEDPEDIKTVFDSITYSKVRTETTFLILLQVS